MTGVERVLVGVSGSIGVVSVCQYLLEMKVRLGAEVKVVTSAAAERMVPAETLALFCDEVIASDSPAARRAAHVVLPQWASVFTVLPASANVLADAARGAAPSPLTAAILAAEPGIVFFPNMNPRMWDNPAVRRNVATLREDGHVVVDPVAGPGFEVATGEVTPGATMPPPALAVELLREVTRTRRAGPGPG